MPRTPGSDAIAACTASRAARIFSSVSVMSVGSSAVVPKRRCAATMAAIPSGVGVVEQHVAAAVHLHVDETGREPGAVAQGVDRNSGRDVATLHQCGNPRALDDDRRIRVDGRAVEDRLRRHGITRLFHRVRVTF